MSVAGDNVQRKVRSDKKIHVNPALDSETHRKLKRLALACDMTKTALAEEIIRLSLNNPDIVNWLQTIHPGPSEFRVIPLKENGQLYF